MLRYSLDAELEKKASSKIDSNKLIKSLIQTID